jgi:lipoprotein-anchoring transpeptidase ErfK/SrfK
MIESMFKKISRHAVAIAIVFGVCAVIVAAAFGGAAYLRSGHGGRSYVLAPSDVAAGQAQMQPSAPSQALQYGSWPALSNANFFTQVKTNFIAQQQSFIEADLTAMQLSVYENGAVVLQVPILTKGRPGSWWETPAGLYQVESKEPNHFSSFGHVYMPWSMDFQGNFFIHGWPYEPDGTPVATAYSGGCIRLSTDDAKKVYDLAKVGMPILVYEQEFDSDNFQYPIAATGTPSTLSGISAKEYLAADLKDNHVFLAQNSTTSVPIASLTKLMTALVAAEYINLDATITVPQSAVVPTSKPRLVAGQQVSAYQLMYPLLDESSNEAAFALADHLGRDRFVSLMNQKAAALGMSSTHFTDPAGREDGNVSTTEDLFALAKYLLNNRSFILKISAGTVGDNAYGPSQFTDLENFNVFNGQADFIGGKVGETTAAGQTIVSLFNETLNGQTRPIVIVALGSTSNAADARAILDNVKANH